MLYKFDTAIFLPYLALTNLSIAPTWLAYSFASA